MNPLVATTYLTGIWPWIQDPQGHQELVNTYQGIWPGNEHYQKRVNAPTEIHLLKNEKVRPRGHDRTRKPQVCMIIK